MSEQIQQRQHNLPTALTPFVGRQQELADIGRRLQDPACRLLTLVGPGGMGKTRLAVEVATARLDAFADGVFLVELDPVNSTDEMITAVADALHFPLSGPDAPLQQLSHYLQHKELLLLLDNFEHLLDAAVLIIDLLQAAPGLTIFITSRAALSLQEEWLYPLDGLNFPQDENKTHDPDVEKYSAVHLFVEQARRVNPGFTLEAQMNGVFQICRLVEGMPLALELAAAWSKTLTCADIAGEIENSLDFLTTTMRNAPARQRSIRAVFTATWQQLNSEEQTVFKQLSIFRGGFERQAAVEVAAASPPVLVTLMDYALLRQGTNGRYSIHELLRQHGEEQLAQSAPEMAQSRQRHAAHFVNFLYTRFDNLLGGRQQQAMAEIEVEAGNVRAAGEWIWEQHDIPAVERYTTPLAHFLEFRSRYLEAATILEKGIMLLKNKAAATQSEPSLAGMLVQLAWMHIRFGRLEEAETVSREADEIYRRLSLPPVKGQSTDPRLPLGVIATIRGDYTMAADLGRRALETARRHDHPWNRQVAHYVLAGASLAQGDYAQAEAATHALYAATRETQDRWFTAYCHLLWGDVAAASGDDVKAREQYEAGFTIRQEFNDLEGMAVALSRLGQLALRRKALAEAHSLYRRSLAHYQDINDKGGLATALHGLGETAVAQQDYNLGRQLFHQALTLAGEIQYISLIHTLLISVAALFLKTGLLVRGVALLALVERCPGCPEDTRIQAEQHLIHYRSKIPSAAWETGMQQGRAANLTAVLASLPGELASAGQETPAAGPAPAKDKRSALSPTTELLVEPLTPRELEVLQHIANGLTNRQIAERLFISVGTTKYYTSQIYGKLNVSNRTQAVARARELALLP